MSLLPTAVRISRRLHMNASPANVFRFLSTPTLIAKWNPFVDSRTAMSFAGPAEGVGASWSWAGGRAGAGRATIISVDPGLRVVLRLEFEKPFKAVNTGSYSLTPDGYVEWTVDETAFVPRLLSRFISLDKLVGGEFEKGLLMLKALVEA